MIQTYSLSPGVTLRYCPDHRFKKAALSLQLLRPMCRQESAMNALLPAVLMRGTRQLPDIRAITQHLDECFGGSASALVRRCGDIQTVGFYFTFLEDRYTLHGEPVLAPMLELLRQLLLEPALEEGAFLKEFVEGEKKNLISTIETRRNDKRVYAADRLMEALCGEDSFAVPRLGDAKSVQAITPQALYRHYRAILGHSPAQIFYIGSAPAETVMERLRPVAEALATDAPMPAHMPFAAAEAHAEEEEQPLQQSKLCLGFTSGIDYRSELHGAMMVLCSIYGGGMTSKLFTHVRERLSLCYYAGSVYFGSKGLMTVSAGIEDASYESARREILEQLEQCRRGNITERELEAGKAAVLSSLDATPDSPGSMEGYYGTAFISGFDRTLEEYRAAVEAVRAEDVIRAARACRLQAEFYLKGTA